MYIKKISIENKISFEQTLELYRVLEYKRRTDIMNKFNPGKIS